jgi:hypothetical protein
LLGDLGAAHLSGADGGYDIRRLSFAWQNQDVVKTLGFSDQDDPALGSAYTAGEGFRVHPPLGGQEIRHDHHPFVIGKHISNVRPVPSER